MTMQTAIADKNYFNARNYKKVDILFAVSVQRKYSSVTFEDGEYKLGAYSYIAKEIDLDVEKHIGRLYVSSYACSSFDER